jgi:hypothetical protein
LTVPRGKLVCALRALIQTYIDVASPHYGVCLKLFLRDDVWQQISGGAPAHRMAGVNVVETSRLEWSDDRLLDLLCRRIAHNRDLCRSLGVDRRALQRDDRTRSAAVTRLFAAGCDLSFVSLLDRRTMRQVMAYVEVDVRMASDRGAAAWTFDPDLISMALPLSI